tara:strand:- start:79 stop:294 length:216 start_codon:yes stop_codon:yes gene_type:complete
MGNELFKVEIESLLMVMDYINYKYEDKNRYLQKKFTAKSLNQCEAIIYTIQESIKNNYKVNTCDESIQPIR